MMQLLYPWFLAARPKTLVATFSPICIGACLAFSDGVFSKGMALLVLGSALLIQVGTNLANDYFDFVKGADTAERVGPVRVTQSGLIAPSVVRRAFVLCFVLAALLGSLIVYQAGPLLVLVGLTAILSGIAYTAGPWPLAYVGLGEVFVMVFFGPVASGFTYYVMSHRFDLAAFALGLAPGAISCAILVANNLRDRVQDAKVNKRTLAVRFGARFAKVEYAFFWLFAFVVVAVVAAVDQNAVWLLPLILIPLARSLIRRIQSDGEPREMIGVLEGTAKGLALFTFLLCVGILL